VFTQAAAAAITEKEIPASFHVHTA